jgi:hypothetical protein
MASGTGHAPTIYPLGPDWYIGEEERVLSIGILGNFGRHVLTSASEAAADVGFPRNNFYLCLSEPRNIKGIKGSKFSPADTRSPSHNFRHKVRDDNQAACTLTEPTSTV